MSSSANSTNKKKTKQSGLKTLFSSEFCFVLILWHKFTAEYLNIYPHFNSQRHRLAAENLVDILIKTEDEIKIDNYKEVDVPKDMVPELEKMDEPYLKT